MIIVTTNEIPDKKVSLVKGLVQGSTVQSKHVGRDIGAGLKTLVGGEIKGYSDLMKEAREIAIKRMTEEAEALGANAIIGMRRRHHQVRISAQKLLLIAQR